MLEYLLKNGKYPDFDSGEIRQANIGIENGKIAYIGTDELDAMETIDVSGLIVSPGFIDIHMHEEDFLKEGKEYVVSKMMLRMGVTTCVGGNCGVMNQDVKTFKNTIHELGGSPVNYLMLTGYNHYRNELGLGHHDMITEEQSDIIIDSMKKDLDEGAIGISFGFEYDPAISWDEIVKAIDCVENDNLMVAAHYRGSCTRNIDSVKEMVAIQNHTGKRFQISHLSSGCAFGLMDKCLDYINEETEKNPRLNYDTYPYNAFSTKLGSTVFDDGCLERWHKDYSDILLTDVPYTGVFCNEEIFRKARAEYPDMLAVAFAMNEEEIRRAIINPYGMIASDAIINNGNGHPRAAGTFPRVLGKYVREEGALTLMDALNKMTRLPAERLRLDGRKGKIAEGYDADLTVFNPETIQDGPTFTDITCPNQGISYVFVGGNISLKHNEILTETAGKFIPFEEI